MTAQTKVTLNQWLLTLVGVAFGVWGGYKVLEYRVFQSERDIITLRGVMKEDRNENTKQHRVISHDIKELLKIAGKNR